MINAQRGHALVHALPWRAPPHGVHPHRRLTGQAGSSRVMPPRIFMSMSGVGHETFQTGFASEPRRFGAPRDESRLHAGVDWHAQSGTAVRGMPERVVPSIDHFGHQAHGIGGEHDGFVARHGEMAPAKPHIFVSIKQKVARAPKSGLVGQLVGIRVPSHMPHVEMLAGTAGGR